MIELVLCRKCYIDEQCGQWVSYLSSFSFLTLKRFVYCCIFKGHMHCSLIKILLKFSKGINEISKKLYSFNVRNLAQKIIFGIELRDIRDCLRFEKRKNIFFKNVCFSSSGRMVLTRQKFSFRHEIHFFYWDLPPLARWSRGCMSGKRALNLMTRTATTKTLSLGNIQWGPATGGTSDCFTVTIRHWAESN